MDPKVFKLKERIKKLAAEQKLLKLARKTKLPKDQFDNIKMFLGKSESWEPGWAACDARTNTVRITVCLNLYHELRGSEFRHGFSNSETISERLYYNVNKYFYDKCLKEEQDLLSK